MVCTILQENGLLEQECARLAASLAAAARGGDRKALRDVLAVNERLQQDKAQVPLTTGNHLQCSVMAVFRDEVAIRMM